MQGQRPSEGQEINIATDTDSHSSNQDCYVTKTIKTRYQRKQNGWGEGKEGGGDRKGRDRKTLKQKKKQTMKKGGGLGDSPGAQPQAHHHRWVSLGAS